MLLTKQNLFNLFKLLCIFIFHDAIFIYYTNLFIIPIQGMRHSRFSQFLGAKAPLGPLDVKVKVKVKVTVKVKSKKLKNSLILP